MLKENYNISIIGKQSMDGDDMNEINLNTVGSYTKRGHTRFIAYKEYQADNPKLSHTSFLKVELGKVTVMYGNSPTRLILEEGKRHLCLYDTGFGSLTLGVFTSAVDDNLDDNGGKLDVAYTMDINCNLSSCNEIHVEVSPRLED
jgi:Uncharacterized protein conserved in bacteria